MFKNNTLTIAIKNNTNQPGEWVAFGYNQGAQSSAGVSVSVSQSSLAQADKESAQAGFEVSKIKIQTNNQEQLNTPIYFKQSDATGAKQQYVIVPGDYVYIMSSIPNLVVINDPKLLIDGKVGISGAINANSTMNINITVKKARKLSNFINNVFNQLFGFNTKVTITGPIKNGQKIVIK